MNTQVTPQLTSPVTLRLAEFIHQLHWQDLPTDIHDLIPILLIDYFRAASVGIHQPWTKKIKDLYSPIRSNMEASLLFSDEQIEISKAAFINGVAAGSLDWDDSHIAAIIHPGVCIWPAAMAMAEMTKASGQELFEAVVAGYETAIRIGMSMQPEHSLRGFQGTPTCGVFGAAAAASKLLHLDVKGTQNALGIAATFACGISQFFVSGSDIKRFHSGKAACNGIEAALLAYKGLSGPPDAIEGVQGFGRAFSDRFDTQITLHELGKSYPIQYISLKPHASSVRMQSAIEAAIELTQQGILFEDIDSIAIGVHPAMVGKLTANQPVDFQQAQLSTPFAVAMVFYLAKTRSGNFSLSLNDYEDCLKKVELMNFSKNIHCYVDSEVETKTTKESVPARLKVTLKNHLTHELFIEFPKGCPQNPMTIQDVTDRLIELSQPNFSQAAVKSWLESAKNTAQLSSINHLLSLRINQ